MDIRKSIKNQKRSYRSFILSMCLIFLGLPITMFIYGKMDIFFEIYLLVIEVLILISIFQRIDNEFLRFESNKYKLVIQYGICRKKINIICSKVVMVHAQDLGRDFEIIFISKSRFRNKKIKKVNYNFLKSHAYISHYYSSIKKKNPEEDYYYFTVKNGGYRKYELLDVIYKTCVYAYFTDEVIEKIKLYRK